MRLINFAQLFKRNGAVEKEIPLTPELKEELQSLRTLEVEMNGKPLFLFYGIYEKEDGKILPIKNERQYLDDLPFASYLNPEDKATFLRLIKNNFDLDELVKMNV